jgi:hypothetical protein
MIAPLPNELRAAVDALEAICSTLEILREDRDHMAEIVKARRALAGEFMAISSALDDSRMSNETKEQARGRLTALRYIVSLHQANWPIMAVRDDPEGYRASAMRASDASRGFVDWMRRLPQQM